MNGVMQQSPAFLGPGTSFMEDNFSMDQGHGEGFGMNRAHDLLRTLFLIITSAPPQIISYQIPEVGDPDVKGEFKEIPLERDAAVLLFSSPFFFKSLKVVGKREWKGAFYLNS